MNGSGMQLLRIQHHQLVKMVTSHTGGHLIVIHIDIPFNRKANLQYGYKLCADT